MTSADGSSNFWKPINLGPLVVNKIPETKKNETASCDELLPQPPFLLTVVAPRKSGKTNLVIDLLLENDKYCKKFDVILIWSRTYKHDSKWKNISLPEGSMTDEFYEKEAERILGIAEYVATKTEVNALFIFDDMITDGIMNSRRMGTLESIAVRGRHANVSIIIITQQYMALSPSVRNNSTNTIFFRIRNGDELEKIAKENRESLSVAQFLSLYNYATKEPFSFLHVNNQQVDPMKRFSKRWDVLLQLEEPGVRNQREMDEMLALFA